MEIVQADSNAMKIINANDEADWYLVWKPWANTLAYYKLETDLLDYSWNNYNIVNNQWVTFTTLNWIKCAYWNGNVWAYSNNNIFASGTSTFTVSIWFKKVWNLSHPQCLWWFGQPNSSQSAWAWIHTTSPWWSIPAWWLMIWRWWNDTYSWYQTNTNWTNAIFIYSGWRMKVIVNWNKVYDNTYSYNINAKPNRIFMNWNDTDKLQWYLRENIFENIARTEEYAKEYFKKSKKLFWIS